ncbi:MAG: 4'-phosphopantetheinyl transferase superfamily protein [Nitrospirota bacterium]
MGSGDFGLQFVPVEQLLFGFKPLLKAFQESSIHVWGCVLEGDVRTIEQCNSWLSVDERARATRFIRPEDRHQYILARGGLRKLLSGCTGLDPAAVILQTGPEGKPALGNPGGGLQSVRFNLSHSHGRMLVGIAGQRDVGVDLEQICSKTEIMKLAKRFYAPAEFDAIASHDTSGQSDAFYRHWVAKEAFLKFKGVGLKFPLGQCRVTMALDGGSAGIHWQKGPAEVERGVVKFLPLPEGWVGAVAAEGTDWTVRLGEWMPD